MKSQRKCPEQEMPVPHLVCRTEVDMFKGEKQGKNGSR